MFLPVQLKLLVAPVDPVEYDDVLVVDNRPPVLQVRDEASLHTVSSLITMVAVSS